MPDDLRLAQARQADGALPPEPAETIRDCRRRRQIDAAAPGCILLEQQRLFDLEAAIGGLARAHGLAAAGAQRLAPLAHRSTSRSASSNAVRSSSVCVSLAATIRRSARSRRPGQNRLAGTPA